MWHPVPAFPSVCGLRLALAALLLAAAVSACTRSPSDSTPPGPFPKISQVTPTPKPAPTATHAPTPSPSPVQTQTPAPTPAASPAPAPRHLATLLGSIDAGNLPAGVDVDGAYHRVYVANEEGRSLTVIDGSTGAVGATVMEVPLGGKPRIVAANSQTGLVYITMYFQRSIRVFDSTLDAVSGTINLEGNPLGLGVNEATGRIYAYTIADPGQGGSFAGLSVIDGATNTVIAKVPVGDQTPKAAGPAFLAINPVANRIYVSANPPTAVLIIDGATNQITAEILLPAAPFGLDSDPSTSLIYVTVPDLDKVLVIDDRADSPTRYQVIGEIPVGAQPVAVRVHAPTHLVYVVNSTGRSITVIDGRTNTVLQTIGLTTGTNNAGQHDGIAIDESSHRVYVTHQFPNIVSVVQGPN